MVNFFQISMGFENDVLVRCIPTETASRASRRFPFLLWTHYTGRCQFLTVRTKLPAGIAPSYVPSFWKPVPRRYQFMVYLQVIRWCDVRVPPHIQMHVQDQKRPP